jgi:DUF4097 and DUF4098 domain-containing protein YvlB
MRVVSLLLAALGLMAQNITIRQDGSDWVRMDTGRIRLADPRGELNVHSQGRIVVHGVPGGDRITYTLTQRVKVTSEAEARRMLSSGGITLDPPFVVSRVSPNAATELTLEVPRQMKVANLQVSLYGGVEVHDFDGGLMVSTPAGEISLDAIQGSVNARSGGGSIHLGKIGGAVQCSTLADSITIESAGGTVNCRTAGGEIVVKDAGGAVWLSSEGGNISVGRAAGPVEAHAISGLIDVGQAGGTVIADTRGGSIRVGSANGVRAESAQGAVRLSGMSGPMNVSTAMGNILAELVAGMALQDSSLMAVSGDITVFIPSNLRISVMATNDTGGAPHIVSDFSEVRGQPFGFSRAPSMVTGAINGGGPVLRINTGRGLIYLRRLK